MAKDRVIRISAEITPTLGNMNEVVSKVRTTLQSGISTIDFTKGAGKDLSKLLDTFSQKYSDFQRLTKEGVFKVEDGKTVLKTGEQLVSTFNELRRIVGDFGSLQVLDAKKLFPQAFDSRVSVLRNSLEGLADAYAKLESKKLDLSAKQNELDKINNTVAELKTKLQDNAQLEIRTENAKKALEEANNKVEALKKNLKDTANLELEKVVSEIDSKTKEYNSKNSALQEKGKSFGSTSRGETTYKGYTYSKWQTEGEYRDKGKKVEITPQQRTASLKMISQYENEKAVVEELNKELIALQERRKSLASVIDKIDTSPERVISTVQGAGNSSEIKSYNELQKAIEEAKEAKENFDKEDSNKEENNKLSKKIDSWKDKADKLSDSITKIKTQVSGIEQNIDFTKISEAYEKLTGQSLDQNLLKTEAGIKQINDQLMALDNDSLEKLKQNLLQAGLGADQAEGFISKFRKGMEDAGHSVKEFTDHEKEVESFRQRLLQFFSIGNSVRLFQRAIRSAFETVKELDSAMTEIAVVSDFSISDMWEKLPEFTAQANELGAAIKDTYEATTLFVQQGLDLQNSMKLSAETLKMARIAGMEAADATDAKFHCVA